MCGRIFIHVTGSDGGERAATDVHAAVSVKALSAHAGTCEVDGAGGHVEGAVTFHCRTAAYVIGCCIIYCDTACAGGDGTSGDSHYRLALDGLHGVGCSGYVKRAIIHYELAVIGVGFVFGAPHVNSVSASGVDGHAAAIHLEVLVDVETVAHRVEHVDGSACDAGVFVAEVGVFGIACDGQCSCAGNHAVPVDEAAGLLWASSGIGEGVVAVEREVDALAVVDVDGGAVGVVDCEVGEVDVALVVTIHVERAVGCRTAQVVDYRVLQAGIGNYVDVGAVNRYRHQTADVFGNSDCSSVAVIHYVDIEIRNAGIGFLAIEQDVIDYHDVACGDCAVAVKVAVNNSATVVVEQIIVEGRHVNARNDTVVINISDNGFGIMI